MWHATLLEAWPLLGACAALAFVLALIWGGQQLLLRRGRPGRPARPAGRRLQLAESIALDTRRRLHLVRCDESYVLIATGGGQDMLIGWVTGPPPPASAPRP